ncbi:hypothetical protein S2M10_14430 [Sphingomonas sp. S2M10]|nr:hypothetical protein [Sphingomonas sp. S2M10]
MHGYTVRFRRKPPFVSVAVQQKAVSRPHADSGLQRRRRTCIVARMPLDAPDNSGHRARLRQRLFEGGPEALLDHELVEYLLALTIPRKDTKPLAKTLLKEFGGLPGLLAADAEAMLRIEGMKDTQIAALKAVHAAALRLLQAKVREQPVLANWQALLDYLRADMAPHAIERVRVLHLNTRNMLIRDELMNEGSIDEAPLYVRQVIARALHLGSAALILVHNHPTAHFRAL